MAFFSTEFGFAPREVTALMGVHTIGKADIYNSGFHGPWVSDEQSLFNNQYYINMADSNLDWRVKTKDCIDLTSPDHDIDQCADGQSTGWQWNVPHIGFNLNADMALFKVWFI